MDIHVGDTVTPHYANWIGKVTVVTGDVVTVDYGWRTAEHYVGALQVLEAGPNHG